MPPPFSPFPSFLPNYSTPEALIDSFENGNVTSNPAWSNDGSGFWDVTQTPASYDGTHAAYAIPFAGTTAILSYTHTTPLSQPSTGAEWFTAMALSGTNPSEYRLIDSENNYLAITINSDRTTMTVTDGTNTDSISVTLGTDPLLFKLEFSAGGIVKAVVYDEDGELVSETSNGITSPLLDVKKIELRNTHNGSTVTYYDWVRYG